MSWQPVAEIQLTKDWQLTQSISGSAFRLKHLVNTSRPQDLRAVVAQAYDGDNLLTYFNDKVVTFRTESQGFVFPQITGILNRKFALKRLDNLTDSWTITIEVLNGMPQSIELPITISEVTGLEQALSSKEAAGTATEAIATHAESVNHPVATPTEKGMMSKDDKSGLNKIVNYAYLNVIKNTQSIASNTDTILTFPTVSSDSSAGWNAATNQWTCPATGSYLIGANLDLVNNATADNTFVLIIYRNGSVGRRFETNNANPPNTTVQLGRTFSLDLVAGDLVDLRIRCPLVTSSTPVSLSAGGMLFIQRVK